MVDDENIKTKISPFAMKEGEIKTFDGKTWQNPKPQFLVAFRLS